MNRNNAENRFKPTELGDRQSEVGQLGRKYPGCLISAALLRITRMLRSLFILLTIAALGTCPYRCCAPAKLTAAGARQAKTCSCCKSKCSGEQSPGKSPLAPPDGCLCDCLCKGAVLGDHHIAVEMPSTIDWLSSYGDLLLVRGSCEQANVDFAPHKHPPSLRDAAGRQRCYSVQSLLL